MICNQINLIHHTISNLYFVPVTTFVLNVCIFLGLIYNLWKSLFLSDQESIKIILLGDGCAETSVIIVFQCVIYQERIPSRMLSHWMTMLLSRSVRECSCQKPSACSSSCCTVPRRVRQFFPPKDTSIRPRFGFQPTGAAHLEKFNQS